MLKREREMKDKGPFGGQTSLPGAGREGLKRGDHVTYPLHGDTKSEKGCC